MKLRSGIFFLFLTSFAAAYSIFQLWPDWYLFTHGTMAEGIITRNVHSYAGSDYFYFDDLRISFRTGNGDNLFITESGDFESGAPGQPVEIFYDAANPTAAVSIDSITTNVLILLVELLVIILSVFSIWQSRRTRI